MTPTISTDQPLVLLERLDGDRALVRTFASRADVVKALVNEGDCDDGCAWADDEHTVCTRCVELSIERALKTASEVET